MPLLRTSNTELVRIELSTEGEWVEVKAKLGKDDERRRESITMRGQMLAPGEEIKELDLGALYAAAPFATMEVAIKRWSVKDPETGKVAQLTAAALQALSDEDAGIINARLAEMYEAPRTDDERKNSSGVGATPSEVEVPLLPSSAG